MISDTQYMKYTYKLFNQVISISIKDVHKEGNLVKLRVLSP